MVATTYEGINVDFAVAGEESGQKYPALQASNYKPSSVKTEIRMCLNEDSYGMLSMDAQIAINADPISVDYGDGDVQMYALPDNVRYVVVGIPQMFAMDKETKEVFRLERGVKLSENNRVTATRLLMAIMVNDQLLMADDDTPQLFTLKLTSSKTMLLAGDRMDSAYPSIRGLNDRLKKHFKVRANLTHLVSVSIVPKAKKFTSKNGRDSSFGVMFELNGEEKPVSMALQQTLYHVAQSEEVKEFLKDPFALKAKQQQAEGAANPDSYADFDTNEVLF